jgi:hypothetical protein
VGGGGGGGGGGRGGGGGGGEWGCPPPPPPPPAPIALKSYFAWSSATIVEKCERIRSSWGSSSGVQWIDIRS